MANTYKNIVITPNIGNTSDPKIQFSGGNTTANTDVNLFVYPSSNGTVSFEGSAGQLFSITNDLSNSLFAVSDVSGIPSLEVFANGLVSVIPFSGNVVFGNSSVNVLVNSTAVVGNTVGTHTGAVVLGTSSLSANGGLGTAGQVLHSNGTATYWAADDNAGGTVTSVASGNGITGGTITSTGTLSAVAGTGTVVNATGIHVNATYIGTLSANNTTYVNGKTEGNLNVNNATTAYGKTEGNLNVNAAAQLVTTRTINGVNFNGTANILVPSTYDANYRRIDNPGGAEYNGAASVTGALQIILPVGWTNSMMRMTIKVYEYAADKGFDLICGGYNYAPSTAWINTFAYILADKDVDRRFNVRFGYTAGGKCVIYIGELASTWSYPQVYVTDVQVGFGGQSATWVSGWTMGAQASAFENVTATVSSTQLGWGVAASTADALVLRDASANFAANNITANTSGTHTGAVVLGTSSLSANGGVGTAGQVLHSNGTATYWAADDNAGGTVTSVAGGTGLTGGTITTTGTLSVNASYIATISANNASFLGTVAAADYKRSNDQNQVDVTVPAASSGTWSTATADEWGNPKFDTTFNKYTYGDAPAYLQYNVPAGMKSAWISQLVWNSGGYVDVHGIQSGGQLVFLRRINTRQTVENTDEGVNLDGSTVTFAASGLDDYTAIRFTVQSGRFHLTGLSFSSADNEGTEGVGMVHPAQISYQGAGSTLDADLLDGNHASAFQTTAGLSANVATLTSNNATNAFGKTEGNLNVNNATTAYGKTEGNLNVNAAARFTTARTLTIGSTGKSFDGTAGLTWTTTEIGAEYQSPLGVPRVNLGDPTVREMALFDGQFTNKTELFNINNLFFETSTDNVTWTTYSVTDAQKRLFLTGDSFANIVITNGTAYFRVRLKAVNYVYLNALYLYHTNGGHTTQVQVFRKAFGSTTWVQHTNSTVSTGGWPGHLYLPFSGIAWNPAASDDEVYFLFIPTWNNPTWAAQNFTLHKFQLWGGYPAGKRNIFTTSEYGDATFPANVVAGTFIGNTVARNINGTAFNSSADITTANWGTARNINGTSVNGSANYAIGRIYDTNYRRFTNPGGGEYVTATPTITGAIQIVFPNVFAFGMYKMTIEVFEYVTNQSFTVVVSGHTSGTLWYNTSAYIIGNPSIDRRYTVRFGRNAANKAVVYIGELASTWSYPQVFLTEFQCGYSSFEDNSTGWAISFNTTAFENVSQSITNSQVGYAVSTNTVNSAVLRDGSGNFSAGTITASLSGNTGGTHIGAVVLGTSSLSANGGVGTAGQVLHSNGSATYWAADDNAGGTVTSVAGGTGLTGGTITTSGTLSVNAAYIATISANNATFMNGNTVVTVMESLRANRNIHGGGTITVDASYNVLWSARFIVISNGRGAHFSTAGYFDIQCPTSGTITGVGGTADKTATAAGIPLGAWEALYYILPIGSSSTSLAANFRVSGYTADVEIPSNWVLICARNADGAFAVSFPNGINLLPGQSYNTTIFSSSVVPTANNSNNLNGKTEGNLNVNNATSAAGLLVHAGRNNEADKIVRTDTNGYIQAGWINTPSGDNGTTAITKVYASSDDYIRTYTPANFRTVLDVPTRTGGDASGTWAINVTGTAYGKTEGNLNVNNAVYLSGVPTSGYARRGGGLGNIDYNAERTRASGFYSVDAAPTNGPPGATYSNFIQMTERGDTSAQIVVDFQTGQLHSRGIQSATPTYSAWRTYLSNTANLNISGGFTVTAYTNPASTSFTVNPLLGNYQHITNNGGFTITAPTSDCAVDLLIINGGTPGAVGFSGFQTGVTGGSLNQTVGHEFILSIRRIAGYSTYSIYALQ